MRGVSFGFYRLFGYEWSGVELSLVLFLVGGAALTLWVHRFDRD